MSLPVSVKMVGIVGAVGVVGAVAYMKFYSWPRQDLESQIAAQRSSNTAFESALTDKNRVESGLKQIAATTLSAQSDEAIARFRSSLGELATAIGLSPVSVNTLQPEGVLNPAGAKVKTSIGHDLAKQTDFWVIRGELVGEGSLEQVVRTVAMVENQPWVHRTEGFSLAPLDKDHQRFSLKLSVATIMVPDLVPKTTPEPKTVPLEPEASARWASIVAKNMFRDPPLEIAKADPPPAVAPAPVPPAWAEWKLTAVVETKHRVEAWVVNTKGSGSAVLNVGSPILGATFVGGSRDVATFEIDGRKYDVQIGQTLEQRCPTSK